MASAPQGQQAPPPGQAQDPNQLKQAVPGTPTPGLGDITLNGTVFAGSIDGGRPLSGARISFQPCNPHHRPAPKRPPPPRRQQRPQ